MKNFLFIPVFFLFLNCSFAQLTPQQAVAEMGRGINLGNTLEPPREGAWNNGPAQESYFDAYVEAGFTNIRIPVRWDEHTGDTAPFAVDESWMDRVEQVVDWGLSRGLYITLNGHHEDWLKTGYTNATLRDRYDAIWTQVAARFKDKSDKLLFEIINEPIGLTVAQINELNERILGIIRATNPTRIVIYGGNMYANSEQLLTAAIPDDDFIIGYYHAYDPWPFSGQGMGTWGTTNDYQQLTNKYRAVNAWSDGNGIPVHHSEFGAIHDCDFNSRMRIYAHNVELCVTNGFAFSAWDDGGDFGILNRGNNTWPEVKDILAHYAADSPNQIFSTFTPAPMTNEPTVVVDWNNRATGNGNIILERSVGGSSTFSQIASLASDATSFTDLDVETGKTYTYRMFTTRTDGTLLHGYPTRVRITATQQTPFNGNAIPIPGVLEMEEYDNGGEGLAYHDTEPENLPAGFRLDEGVDIGPIVDGFILEYVANGEWVEYTVNVAQAGVYNVKAEVGSEQANGTFNIVFEQNNSNSRFTVPSTGDWKVFTEISASNQMRLEAGEQVMRLNITNGTPFNIDYLTFTFDAASSIPELEAAEAGFNISPNPTNGVLNIDLSETLIDSQNQIEIFSINGKKVDTFRMSGATKVLDLSHLEGGTYLVRLVGEELNLMHRVVVY